MRSKYGFGIDPIDLSPHLSHGRNRVVRGFDEEENPLVVAAHFRNGARGGAGALGYVEILSFAGLPP
jgi:hypothetical protein